jgi:hypothetical protein
MDRRVAISFAVALTMAGLVPALHADKPFIDHQPVVCSPPGKNSRICAVVADDGVVKRVEVFFRAVGQKAFYRSEMSWDAIRYCATLPLPHKSVRAIEYYVWVIDDEVLIERTPDQRISVDPGRSCEYPVIDDDPERISRLVVYATTPKQGKKIRSFKPTGIVRFVAAKKR